MPGDFGAHVNMAGLSPLLSLLSYGARFHYEVKLSAPI